jgi:limonene-1,2-epoxide hydrolase
MQDGDFTRRDLFMAGGTAAAFLALTSTAQAADESTADEKANIEVIRRMIADWNVKGFDPADLVKKYMTKNVVVSFLETAPPNEGADAVTATWRGYHAHGENNVTTIKSAYAKGPIVVIQRVDISKVEGKPDKEYEVVGVFVLKNGKIKDWRDYYTRWPT